MSNVTNIDDVRLRSRRVHETHAKSAPRGVISFARKTEASKANVDAMTRDFEAEMRQLEKEQAEQAELNRTLEAIKNVIEHQMMKLYGLISPNRAEVWIELLHSNVRKKAGVE